jgi:CheY-like chemotaxis protein
MTRVLLVDDDDAIRNVISKMLTILGCFVETAHNGLEAVERFRDHPERIDLVVTDLQMPVLNGHEAVRQIRQYNPSVRFICMSGSDAVICPAGVTFLSKPCTLADVQECVFQALAEAAERTPVHH